MDGRDSSGSGILLTESSDISRRIRSNLLKKTKAKKRKLDIYVFGVWPMSYLTSFRRRVGVEET